MNPRILGLHHVTATVEDAQQDLDFYRRLLGLRLVKKTVNFDNRGVYHFYYGTETGTPGTIMTTFPYKGMGVPVGRKGSGQITRTAFSIPVGATGFWRERLREHGVTPGQQEWRQGEEVLTFLDPSGLEIELVATRHDRREPWITPGVQEAEAIGGIHTLSLSVAKAAPSIAFLQNVLGFDLESGEGGRTRLGVAGGGPGRSLDLVQTADQGAAANGLGTVHHLALAVESADAQLAFRERLLSLGVPVTED
jgi:glyoxalase family protein